MPSFAFTKQLDVKDCGPACLKMISKHHGRNFSLPKLRELCYLNRSGVSLLSISDAAEKIGYRSVAVNIPYETLIDEVPFPCIVHWKQKHFVVVYNVKKKKHNDLIFIADPAYGLVKCKKNEFINAWSSSKENDKDFGICLLLETTPEFYKREDEVIDKTSFRFLLSYIKPHTKFIAQLILGMLLGSILQLIFPFLTQSVVDVGIGNQDLNFITLILIAQLVLFFSQTTVEFFRSWILLHVGTRINISLISDFLIKLMKLPIGFFDSRMIGDIMQRIGDHTRIENFLTASSLQVLFSFINLVVFGIVLGIYSLKILSVFIVGSVLYTLWVLVFMKQRRTLDYRKFAQMSDNQSFLIQIISGMQEIKLNNCEKQKRWYWEKIQARLFNVNIKGLILNQYQQAGGVFFNQTKNIIITFIAAESVVKGNMTLGMMMAVQYIIGQLNAPITQMIGFIRAAQDAKISLERLGEVHLREDEETSAKNDHIIHNLPNDKTITINNLSFQYDGPRSPLVIDDLSLIIPENKVTAIVGPSGSGKTTLLKLLLGFYNATKGEIKVSNQGLNTISKKVWRSKVGAVMQDGFIFSDSIANNIVIGDDNIVKDDLWKAIEMSNIHDFIEALPLGLNTRIGQDGMGISQGQKQRILIARSVYKNPQYLFFDEATNALDANNEKIILNNMSAFYKGRTVIVIAHRLSTVKNADQIVVLEKGKIIEKGNHFELSSQKGAYYNLVKNQLELGN